MNAAGTKSSTSFREGFVGPLKGMKPAVEKAFLPATVGLAAVGVGAKKAIDAASDLNESMNAVQVTFGDASKTVLAFSGKAAKEAGLSMREFNELVTPVGASLRNAGYGADDAAKASVALTKRAADMASVFNTSVPEALGAIQAGLRGEADPLERFGVGLSDSAVKAKAAAMGMKIHSGELTANQKAQARLALLMEQTNRLQGDFANTSDGAANQQRILHAQLENVQASLGQALLPAFTSLVKILGKLAGLVAKHQTAFKVLVSIFTAFAGAIVAINLAMKAYAAGAVVVKAATAAWTAVQWLLNAALDANPIGLLVLAIGALVVGLVIAYKKSETFRGIVDDLVGSVGNLAESFVGVLDWLKDHWPEIATILAGPFAPLVALATDAFGIRSALTAALEATLGFVKKRWPEIAVVLAGPFAPLVALATDAFGVRSALEGAIRGIIAFVTSRFSDLYNAGKSLGAKLKDGVVDGVTGVANAAWGVIDNIRERIVGAAETVKGWGRSVGVWIREAVVDGVTGVALGAWGIIDNVGQMVRENVETVKGWGVSIGRAIKDGVVAGIQGLATLIRNAVKAAIRGIGGRVGGAVSGALGLGRSAAAAYAPGPAASAQLAASGRAGGAAGGLAGPAPPLANLRALLSDLEPPASEPPNVAVRVFIGETELTDIVRVQVQASDARTAQVLMGGVA